MTDDLKEKRGFGMLDPIPLVSLYEDMVAVEVTGNLDQTQETALYSGTRTVMCPMAGFMERPVTDCRCCESFIGIGEVKITGAAMLEQRFRTVCRFPRPRPVRIGARQEGDEYKDRMHQAIKKAKRPEHEAEFDIFVKTGCSLNCPVARAKTGSWRVDSPPCPICPHYHGLLPRGDKIHVQCSHPFSLRFKQTVMGGMLI